MKNDVPPRPSLSLSIKKILVWGCGTIAGIPLALASVIYAMTYHPGPVERMAVLGRTNAPILCHVLGRAVALGAPIDDLANIVEGAA